ncbi:MAG: hypothetical protein GX557_03705 [Chloroflexi bacterium]|nr:hypothetical protein [Chloroflexota bacterium]
MELLFESRTNLAGYRGHLNFVQFKPRIHPEPVLTNDTYADGAGVTIYGSVLQDGGRLRMWYHAIPRDWDYRSDMSSIAYAESVDGIHWTKPALGIVAHGPEPNNLTNLGLHSATVFIDPEGAPSHRYRATGCGYKGLFLGHPDVTTYGYYTAHSADGLRWELDAPRPRWLSADVITSAWHPGRRSALIAMKYTPRCMRLMRRSIHTAEFRDGVYGEPVSALYPDEFDDVRAATRGFHSCDYYGMGMLPAGQGTVGFLWNYWHELPYTGSEGCPAALYGTCDMTLVYQPEAGGRWFHMPGRPLFVDHSQVPWARSGWINSASNVVTVGDEQRLYFSGTPNSHGFGWTPDWKPTPKWIDWMKRNLRSGISYASWPKWRLFGFEADPEGSLTIRLGAVERPSALYLNYEVTKADGLVRAELLDGEGVVLRTLDDCPSLTGDSVAQRVVWRSGDLLPAAPALAVRLHVENARVYAYELRP